MKAKAQDHIVNLEPYVPGTPIEIVAAKYNLDPSRIVKLASNENPLGMSPKARAALEAGLVQTHRYPNHYRFTQQLAAKLHVDPGKLVIGNGSNDILDLVARVFLGKGDEAISSQYAFAVYHIATQTAGATNVVVPAKDFGHDLNSTLAAITPRTRVIWIANPGNPIGTYLPHKELHEFLNKVPSTIIVVLDEAYHDYLPKEERIDTIKWLADYPNLILTRTFSKLYGLAGVRLGYGIMHPDYADFFNRARHPFNVNILAMIAGGAALDDDEFAKQTQALNAEGKKLLHAEFDSLGLDYLPAFGNFVTVHVPNGPDINEKLLRQGVIVRPLGGYGLPDYLRITIGLPEENEILLSALRSSLSKNGSSKDDQPMLIRSSKARVEQKR